MEVRSEIVLNQMSLLRKEIQFIRGITLAELGFSSFAILLFYPRLLDYKLSMGLLYLLVIPAFINVLAWFIWISKDFIFPFMSKRANFEEFDYESSEADEAFHQMFYELHFARNANRKLRFTNKYIEILIGIQFMIFGIIYITLSWGGFIY
jgi:hypothetical protein